MWRRSSASLPACTPIGALPVHNYPAGTRRASAPEAGEDVPKETPADVQSGLRQPFLC